MYAKADDSRGDVQARGDESEDGDTREGAVRSVGSRKRRPAHFSRPQLVREFELLMLTALVETARRERSA